MKERIQRNRLDVINDETDKPVIPIGPRFQAEIPYWTGPPCSEYYNSSTKWLGTCSWPNSSETLQTEDKIVGKGRPDFCWCASPGSIECVKRHISDKQSQLQLNLGPAFWRWKFDEMGEGLSKLWNNQEQEEFECITKRSSFTQGNSFLELALQRFPTQTRETIIGYYFNVYLPRHIEILTRSGCKVVDLDDDEDLRTQCPRISRKRYRADGLNARSGKYVMKSYLNWRK